MCPLHDSSIWTHTTRRLDHHSLRVVGSAERRLWCNAREASRVRPPTSPGSAVRLLPEAEREVREVMASREWGSACSWLRSSCDHGGRKG